MNSSPPGYSCSGEQERTSVNDVFGMQYAPGIRFSDGFSPDEDEEYSDSGADDDYDEVDEQYDDVDNDEEYDDVDEQYDESGDESYEGDSDREQ